MGLADLIYATERPEKVTLYFKQGSSDKVYQAQLIAEQDMQRAEVRWTVRAAYGRRGSSMRHISKLQGDTIYYTEAKAVYDKLVQSKLRKGYSPGPGGTPFNATKLHADYAAVFDSVNRPEPTGWLPQLLNQVTLEEAHGIYRGNEGNILLQTKWDGERRAVMCNVVGRTTMHVKIIGANRKGLEVPLTDAVRGTIDKLCMATTQILILDTEDMGDYLVIFDVLKYGREDLTRLPYRERVIYLRAISEALSEMNTPFLMVDMPFKPLSFVEFCGYIEDAKERNEEGVVIRVGSTEYLPGKPNTGGGLYKLKFKESATCRVEFIHPTKSSVGLELFDEVKQQWVSVGNTTIYPNNTFPDADDIIEVEYLYAYPGGSLYQPVFKGPRPDIDEDAAVLSQLKYKKDS
ncbi:MAG: hypothetical protein DRQ89_13015 [Epsilonproteobacteria bacterium]|nr:MAG: hypothetical protein DRQ89_13015 [Campylobacterota bacterium]